MPTIDATFTTANRTALRATVFLSIGPTIWTAKLAAIFCTEYSAFFSTYDSAF